MARGEGWSDAAQKIPAQHKSLKSVHREPVLEYERDWDRTDGQGREELGIVLTAPLLCDSVRSSTRGVRLPALVTSGARTGAYSDLR